MRPGRGTLVCLALVTGCAPGAAPQATTQDPDSTHAAAAAEHAMSGMSMPTVVEDLHMKLTPARLPDDDLDQRIPLSIARWHEHVNWCIPPRGGIQHWRDSTGGRPVFGPQSPIATAEACTAVGGRFLPRIFGWMVHVNAFASDDPRVIWAVHHHEGMEETHH